MQQYVIGYCMAVDSKLMEFIAARYCVTVDFKVMEVIVASVLVHNGVI